MPFLSTEDVFIKAPLGSKLSKEFNGSTVLIKSVLITRSLHSKFNFLPRLPLTRYLLLCLKFEK